LTRQEALRRGRVAAAVLIAVFSAIACSSPLPEEGSRAASLYRERCGTCHRAYAPSSIPFATWEMIFPRMERLVPQGGAPPLDAEERRILLDYLRRHSA
jgi:hypothetical protein